jgi:hypothetical protein
MNNFTHIYAETDTCEWKLKNLSNNSVRIYRDLNEFLAVDSDQKSAVLHLPYPMGDSYQLHDRLNQLIKHCHHVAILMSELHTSTVEFFRLHQHPKIKYFISGIVDHCSAGRWMDWLHRTTDFYKKNPQVLDQINPYQVKTKTFDILLGRNKPHRTFVYNFINNNNLNDQVIMTYLKGADNLSLQEQDTNGWIWEDAGLELPDQDFTWTVTPIRYQGQGMSLSQVIPLSIYNQTAYSIVAETNYDNNYSFFTEKIVKPILARRLFLVVSGQYYLRNLRSLGFKTFDGIIDETYDTIADFDQRGQMITEQMIYLFSQDQQIILDEIKPIVEHNYMLMIETDWYGDFSKEFQAVVLARTN